ncbi:unnamed protein product [Caenorhabditis sp. 36 PRJEB53466]|nr:unnamed protein product [Caenorhabditis sp. 36 PRJEB53466]
MNQTLQAHSICLTYVHNLLPVDMEVLSWTPTLVVYRNILSERQVAEFLGYIDAQELVSQKTSDFGTSRETTHRRANGSFIDHGATGIASEVHRKLSKRIPAINFESAELFSALSYHPGGHYSVHYDYLTYLTESQYDWWMRTHRNRVATLIFVLQTAEHGGGTVFPSIGTTVRVNAGDAFLWFNAGADESQEMLSNHGGCPIYAGRKVITTLWIRAKDQPILPMASTDHPIHASWLIPSFSEPIRSELPSQCPISV